MDTHIPFHKSIHFRLILLFSLVVLLGALINSFLTLHKTEKEFRRVLEGQFSSAIAITENAFDLIAQMALLGARHLVTDPTLGDAMCSDKKLPEEIFQRFGATIGADSLIVLDDQGRLRFHSADPKRVEAGDSLRATRIVRQTLKSETAGSTILEDVGNLVIYSSEIRHEGGEKNGRICGIALVGYVINNRLIANIAQNSPVDITIIRRNAVMASSFNHQSNRLARVPVSYVEYQGWLNDSSRTIRRTRIDSEVYFAAAQRLKLMDPAMSGSLLLTQKEKGLADIQRGIVTYHLWIFFATLVIAILVSSRFTLHILKPLHVLLKHSHDINTKREIHSFVTSKEDEIGLLAKHINLMMVDLRLSNEILEMTVAERTEALQLANKTLEQQATHDALTGLPNRRLFDDRLEQAIKRASRHQSKLALLFIDIDGFKQVNDTHGHSVGDQLLTEVANRLSCQVRGSDTVSRLGGDEFTVILDRLENNADSAAMAVGEKLLAALLQPFSLPKVVSIGGSIGVALYPDHAETTEGLLSCADSAMYNAKKKGKGRVTLFQPEMLAQRVDGEIYSGPYPAR